MEQGKLARGGKHGQSMSRRLTRRSVIAHGADDEDTNSDTLMQKGIT